MSAFASSCRRNEYDKTTRKALIGGTVKPTIMDVRLSFRMALQTDRIDADGKPSLFLTRQLTGYRDADPSTRQQKALPVRVFEQLQRNQFTTMEEAVGELSCGAFFFGMRDCEKLVGLEKLDD